MYNLLWGVRAYVRVCAHTQTCTCRCTWWQYIQAITYMWRSEGNFVKLVLSFHLYLKGEMPGFACRCLYLLSHLTDLIFTYFEARLHVADMALNSLYSQRGPSDLSASTCWVLISQVCAAIPALFGVGESNPGLHVQ